ncbi:hypothetical protein K402DRAFT_399860 [Aulographum hederae CBS 113979]|uniref:SAP domain-containing protein n=1 Tax=Aulographum hederae CBS 113979 TaxID=1176131 RepID=A0A6G1HFP2_9PEZI|nr:hypothetical protein K402DRAFT_399860 [Aulographum hederae CBS 113979]
MADYSKRKVDELTAMLKERSLPSSGKKAELIARLEEADRAAKPSALEEEDEIDWDDDDEPIKIAEPAAAEPATVAPAVTPTVAPVATSAAPVAPASTEAVKPTEPATTVTDFAPPAELAAEFATILKRLTKFGDAERIEAEKIRQAAVIEEMSKLDARAAKFGKKEDGTAEETADQTTKLNSLINKPLTDSHKRLRPANEEMRNKRARHMLDGDDANDDRKRARGNNDRNGGRRGRDRKIAGMRGKKDGRGTPAGNGNRNGNGNGGRSQYGMSEADKKLAEARRANPKFAAPVA